MRLNPLVYICYLWLFKEINTVSITKFIHFVLFFLLFLCDSHLSVSSQDKLPPSNPQMKQAVAAHRDAKIKAPGNIREMEMSGSSFTQQQDLSGSLSSESLN